jgi:hypothetical protein
MFGTLGQQAQDQFGGDLYTNLSNYINLTELAKSELKLEEIRNMPKNKQLALGKNFGLDTSNLQASRAWLDWLTKAAGL